MAGGEDERYESVSYGDLRRVDLICNYADKLDVSDDEIRGFIATGNRHGALTACGAWR